MKIIKNDNFKYISTLFGISNKKLLLYSEKKEGEEKYLLTYILLSFDKKFIENPEPVKIKGVTYLTIEEISFYFGFRKDTVINWESEKRKRLKRCLLNTPKAYVEYIKTNSKLEKELKALFPN